MIHHIFEPMELHTALRPLVNDGYIYISEFFLYGLIVTILNDETNEAEQFNAPISPKYSAEAINKVINDIRRSEPDKAQREKWIRETWQKLEVNKDEKAIGPTL